MKRLSLYTLILGGLLFSGCTEWLDINYTPNSISQEAVSKDQLLTYVEHDINNDRVKYLGFHQTAGQITKSGTYAGSYSFLLGTLTPANVNDYWIYRYARSENLLIVKNKALEEGQPAYVGIAETLTVIEFRELVDIFGNIPYTEALQGEQNLTPKYDKAEDVYADLLKRIDYAIEQFDEAINHPQDLSALKKSDINCKGDIQQWRRYAYTIKLSLLMRVSNVQDVAKQVDEIKDKCLGPAEMIASNPGFYKASGKLNLLYEFLGRNYQDVALANRKQYVPTSQLVDLLRNNNDPRLRVYVEPRQYLGDDETYQSYYSRFGLENEYYIGTPYGAMQSARAEYVSQVGFGVVGRSSSLVTAPICDLYVASGSIVQFYLAEAALRGMIPGGDAKAKEYYEAGVKGAMQMYEVPMRDAGFTAPGIAPAITTSAAEAAAAYLSQNNNKVVNWNLMTTDDEKMCAIQTQKWLSLYMLDPQEAWSEQRRTDYPVLHASIGLTQGSKIIARFPYPSNEQNINPVNYAAQDEVDIFNSLIFWDKKNDEVEKATPYM